MGRTCARSPGSPDSFRSTFPRFPWNIGIPPCSHAPSTCCQQRTSWDPSPWDQFSWQQHQQFKQVSYDRSSWQQPTAAAGFLGSVFLAGAEGAAGFWPGVGFRISVGFRVSGLGFWIYCSSACHRGRSCWQELQELQAYVSKVHVLRAGFTE